MMNPDQMVTMVTYRSPSGVEITIRAPAIDGRWLRALLMYDPTPFKTLLGLGYRAVYPPTASSVE